MIRHTPPLLLLVLTLACKDGTVNDTSSCVDEAERNWYPDVDGDGFGDSDGALYWGTSCDRPAGTVDIDGDCDDADSQVHPGVEEVCGDAIDNDCDGVIDDRPEESVSYYRDGDGDGFGDPEQALLSSDCAPPEGYVADATDCDDGDAAVHPDATEYCDLLDNNCDGQVDEEVVWYADQDGDGFGDLEDGVVHAVCDREAVEGRVRSATDCDDGNASVHPGAEELCGDGVDNDCDGELEDESVVTWYADQDGDSFGDPERSNTASACEQPRDYVDNAEDCDDASSAVYPGAPEICDGVGNDCETLGDWEEAAEAGMVSFYSAAAETWTDLSGEAWFDGATPLAFGIEEDGELRFCAGDFYTNIMVLAGDVTIAGAGRDETALHGPGRIVSTDYRTNSVSNPSLLVHDVSFTGGQDVEEGGALHFEPWSTGGGTLEVVNASFESNQATNRGGALYATSVFATLTDVSFSNNYAGARGGALAIRGGTLDAHQLMMTENHAAGSGGAILLSTNLTANMEDCSISGSSAMEGGAIFLDDRNTQLQLTNVDIRDSTAIDGGALYMYGDVSAVRSSMVDNSADDDGGHVYLAEGNFSTSDSTFSGGHAGGCGGALRAYAWNDPLELNLMEGTTISGNTATNGGALCVEGANNIIHERSLTLSGASITNNSATNDGGGLHASKFEVVATGDFTAAQGIYANTAGDQGSDIFIEDDTINSLTATDWDLADPQDSSAPDGEIYIQGDQAYYFGADATFTCDSVQGCN